MTVCPNMSFAITPPPDTQTQPRRSPDQCSHAFSVDGGATRIHFVFVRVIKRLTLREFAGRHPKTRRYLDDWHRIVRAAMWQSLVDVRRTFPSADMVKTASGKPVVVFNVCGNEFRLIVAIHFNKQRVYILRLLPHAEYSKDRWKAEL